MEKKSNTKKIILWLLVALILIALAVLVFSGRLFNTDRLRRAFAYMSADKNEAGQLAELKFLNQQGNAFADYNGGLAIASATGAELITMAGESVLDVGVTFAQPAVITAGEIAVFYDIGGTSLLMYQGAKQLLSLSLETPILSASLNGAGYLALVAGESGYKAAVTVYDPGGAQVFKLYISSSYVVDAAVSEDSKYLVAAGVMYGSSGFCTKLMRYDLGSEEEVAAAYVQDVALFDLRCMENDMLCALSDTGVYFFNGKLEQTGAFALGSYYLARADLGGDGFAVLLLREQRSGNRAHVVTVGTDGAELGRIETGEEILDMSACGRYVALLYPDSAAIHRQDMSEYDLTQTTGDTRSILMRSDGTLMLISSDTARLFVG